MTATTTETPGFYPAPSGPPVNPNPTSPPEPCALEVPEAEVEKEEDETEEA